MNAEYQNVKEKVKVIHICITLWSYLVYENEICILQNEREKSSIYISKWIC